MSDLTLFHAPNSRSSSILWLLEELGVPYAVTLIDIRKGDQRKPEYLAVNPMGKVPAIRHRGEVVTEASAVATYLADAFPLAGLAPALSDPKRGPYLRWMFFAPACLEPAVTDRAFKRDAGPQGQSPYGDFDTMVDTLAAAVRTGPYLLGDTFSAADVYVGSGIRWTLMFDLLPKRPEFVDYVKRIEARPALAAAQAKEQEQLKQLGQ